MVVETLCACIEAQSRDVQLCLLCLQIRVFVRVRPLNGREDPSHVYVLVCVCVSVCLHHVARFSEF